MSQTFTPQASVRTLAVQGLVSILKHQRKADVALEQLGANLDTRDRALLHELVLGVLRYFYSLEADFSRFLKQKPDIEARMTLLLGTYQLRYMRVPSHAAVSECVNVMKLLQPKASGMVNAVLRKVAAGEGPKKLKPHQRVGIPNWLYKNWRDAFGQHVVQAFSQVLQTPAHLCVAVFVDRETWLAEVYSMGIDVEKGAFSPYAALLPVGTNVTSLPGFDEGAFTVMDQAAQMAVLALDAPEDGLILDVCAAPGGKTALLAHRFPKARIIAVEFNSKRIPRLKQNLLRLKCNNVRVMQADALYLSILESCADAIFLDAPCSASGILRRHPDAKFLHDEAAVNALVIVQKNMLLRCLEALKEDAILVYAVCSINPQENEQVIEGLNVISSNRILPADDHDGFFWAKLHK
ncbi:MAG: transcription antitermination factor NusB [Mariprofundaceae bacterium]|nr:transcription antitermination factor NusB [Mariprofundaceae bacterium]